MTKKTRIDELYEQEIDYSMPIDRFARKAKALLNRLSREMKEPGSSYAAEYGDAAARIYLNVSPSIKLLTKFDDEVQMLVAGNKELTKLGLLVENITVGAGEITIAFC